MRTLVSGRPPGRRIRHVVDRADPAVEELVLIDGQPIRAPGPEEGRLRPRCERLIDPVPVRRADALEERAARELLEAVRAPPDRPDREDPEAEHEKRKAEGVARRHEEEGRGQACCERERGEPDPVLADAVLQRPQRQEHERVRDGRGREEPVERDRDDEQRGHQGGDRGEHARTRSTSLDPREERDAQKRSDVEHVPLLDPVRELGRERRDDGDDADGDRHGRGEEGLEPRVERAGAGNQDDGRCERDHEHVEGELGNVPPQVPKRLPDVVAPLTDGGVGTEQVLRRPSGRELDDQQCDGERRDDAVQPAESQRSSSAGRAVRRSRARAARGGRPGRGRPPALGSRTRARPARAGGRPTAPSDVRARRGARARRRGRAGRRRSPS